jgi:Spy/CpxP family protein refolding chaperone
MTRMIVITGFVIAFSAGLMSGIAWKSRAPGDRPDGKHDRDSWIADQLSLSPDQQRQMKEIWSGFGGRRDGWQKREQIRREKDEAIANLVRPEDMGAYDRILEQARQKTDALEADGKEKFQKAVEKTKAILNDEQRRKYEELLSRGPGHGRDGRDRERDKATTKPGQP